MRVVRQSLGTECGLACLAMALSHHKVEVELAELRDAEPPSANGVTIRQLVTLSARYGLVGRAVRVDVGQLRDLVLPAILHWGFNHFIVLEGAAGKDAWRVVDPGSGRRTVSARELSDHFTGVAVEFRPTSELKPQRRLLGASINDFWTSQRGLKRTTAGLLILSVTLQVLLLAAPMTLAALVDESVRRVSPSLAIDMAAVLVGLVLMTALGEALRRTILANLGAALNAQINLNLMRHLLWLDFPYFISRRLNDTLSRVDSTRAIRDVLTEEAVPTLVDGLFALCTAGIVFFISPVAGAIMIGCSLLYLLVKLGLFGEARERAQGVLDALAAERGMLTDTLRGIATVKLLNAEASRLNAWCGANLRALDATQRQKQLTAILAATRSGVGGLDLALIAVVGVLMVIGHDLSYGGLMALLIYRQQFQDRALSLIDRAHELRLLGLHFERLSDIVSASPERIDGRLPRAAAARPGSLVCSDLWFRHAGSAEWLLKGVSFEARPGEFLAICGQSGGGKTTLLRALTGLVRAERGEIVVDGHILAHGDFAAFRDHIGVVLQDDQVFTGTILENISSWDVPVDEGRVAECARLACIDTDIARLPMGYHTLLGDMGSSLSGGQRQRLFIARALYKKPRLILLDEGTANLDVALEATILDNLRATGATVLCIAHRPSALAKADRVLALSDGVLGPVQDAIAPLASVAGAGP